ncbi:hypothetical protein B0O80DRAFT_460888 [Mortierella sp. GBAus27b]|nr:hypothetical protein B0O80DRAFT_460888 [Mortierella sp. GBAus27b]
MHAMHAMHTLLALILSLLLAMASTTTAQITPTPSEAFGFALAGSKLYVQGGKNVVKGNINSVLSQLYSLDLSTSWNVDLAPWTALAPGVPAALINAVATPDNRTFCSIIIGANNTINVSMYDIKSNSWDYTPVSLAPDGDDRQGIRPVIDPNTGLIYMNSWTKLDVVDLSRLQVGLNDMPDGVYTSRLFSGAAYIKSRNSIMYFGGLNGSVLFDPTATYVVEYSISTKSWGRFATTGQPPVTRSDFCMASSEDGNTVIIYGGRIDLNATHTPPINFTSTLYMLDTKSGQWTQGPDGDVRSYMACVIVGDQFVAWGGMDGSSTISGPPVIFSLKSKTWVKYYNPPAYMVAMGLPPGSSSSQPGAGTDSSSSSSSSNLGAILGGVFGCLFVVSTSGLIYLYMKRKEDRIKYGQPQSTNQNPTGSSSSPSGRSDEKLSRMTPSYLRDPQDPSGAIVFSSPMDSYTVNLKGMDCPPPHPSLSPSPPPLPPHPCLAPSPPPRPCPSTIPQPQQPFFFAPSTIYSPVTSSAGTPSMGSTGFPTYAGAPATTSPVPVTHATSIPTSPTNFSNIPSRENFLTDLSGDDMAYSRSPPTATTMSPSPAFGIPPLQTYNANPGAFGPVTMGNNNAGVGTFRNNSNVSMNMTAEPIATAVNPAYVHPAGRSPVLATKPATGLVYVPPMPESTSSSSPLPYSGGATSYGGRTTPPSHGAATVATPASTNASIASSSEGSRGSPNLPPLPQRPVQNNNIRYSSVITGPIGSVDMDGDHKI